MLQVKCIGKIRDKNNHIIEYKIIDKNKNATSVKPEELKSAIRSGQIEITNLTLTSDNRITDKRPDTSSKLQNSNIENLLNKVKSLGYTLNTFATACRHKCYIASLPSNTRHLLIIPDDVKYIYNKNVNYKNKDMVLHPLYNYFLNLRGALRVMGGSGLRSTRFLFCNCHADSIDLSSFDTGRVNSMHGMFYECFAYSIGISSLDTSKVTDMGEMFFRCTAQSLDLRLFDTSNVKNMHAMFGGCEAQSLDLRSFDTRKVIDMAHMFVGCKAQSIYLSSFNTSNVKNMGYMFGGCEAQSLALSSFNTRNVTNMENMFSNCKAQSLDLTSFDTGKVTNMEHMFAGCKAHSINISLLNTNRVKNMD